MLRLRLRIIPARAGFTMPDTARLAFATDHPRSRGVYPILRALMSIPVGSSPLARGLRQAVSLVCGEHGIIPARAGFT